MDRFLKNKEDPNVQGGSRSGTSSRNYGRGQARRERLVIPPIPESERWNYLIRKEESEEEDTSDGGLKYDKIRSKYWDGRRLNFDTTKSFYMKIASVDQEGFFYINPLTPESENFAKMTKKVMAATYNSNLIPEEAKRCNFEKLMKGEIIVAKINYQDGKVDYVRGRYLGVCPQTAKAKLVDVDTTEEYLVLKERLYKAYQSIMLIPFLVIKCRIKQLRFLEGTDVIQKLFQKVPAFKYQPSKGFECVWNDGKMEDVPEIQILNCDFGDEFFKHLGNIMGAKHRLMSGSSSARICNVNEAGNFWLHYPEDLCILDKIRSLLREETEYYCKILFSSFDNNEDHMPPPHVYITRISRNDLARVIIYKDAYNENIRPVTPHDETRVLVECIDTGNILTSHSDEMVRIERFSMMLRNFPAMCYRVRQVGVKSLSKICPTLNFYGTQVSVEICSEPVDDAYPMEVKMNVVRKREGGPRIIPLENLLSNPGTQFYSESEMEALGEKRRKRFEEKEWITQVLDGTLPIPHTKSTPLPITFWLDIMDGNNEEKC